VFALYPLAHSPWLMGGCAVLLGLTLGSVQPMIMSTLHQLTPDGRYGEVIAMRSMVMNASSTAMPLVFGAAGTALGAAALFWLVGAAVAAGSWVARRLPAAVRPRSGCRCRGRHDGMAAGGGGMLRAGADGGGPRRRGRPRAGAQHQGRGRRRLPAAGQLRFARVAGGVEVGRPVDCDRPRSACEPIVSDGTVRAPSTRSMAAASSSLTISFSVKGTPRCTSSWRAVSQGRQSAAL
jgi:MFS family permease